MGTVHNAFEDTSPVYAPGTPLDNQILVTTEVETLYNNKRDVEQLESNSWIFADGSGR